jgi:transcriptional regulator with PAS, ATPase and Fis domain
MQGKLLRVLQERRVEPLGAEDSLPIDVRVVSTSSANLEDAMDAGDFRGDLYYRLAVVPLEVPPLRARGDDLEFLSEGLAQGVSERTGVAARSLSEGAYARLRSHSWPGNVRELENAVQRAVALAGGGSELAAGDLLPRDDRWRGATEVPERVQPLREYLREREVEHLRRALVLTGGHRTQTAELLGISRKVLWEKMRDYGLEAPGG